MAGNMSDSSSKATGLTKDVETELPLHSDTSVEEGKFQSVASVDC